MKRRIIVGIYNIINLKNNKRYIGQSTNVHKRLVGHKGRLKKGKHTNLYLQNSWNKYKEEDFIFELIVECDKNQLDELEQYYCNLYKTNEHDFGFNLRKISKSNKGFKMTYEQKTRLSISHIGVNKGKIHSKEQNEAHSLAMKGRKYSEEIKNKKNEKLKGQKRTQETIEKLKIANKGERNPASKLNEKQVIEIKKLIKSNYSIKKIAEIYKVSCGIIGLIKNEITWKHVILEGE